MDLKLEKIIDEKKHLQFLNYSGIAFTSSTHSRILFKKKPHPSCFTYVTKGGWD
jgi:hypothetical protein